MRIPIVRGRDFSPGEFAEAQVIVDQRAADSLWPGANPVGRLIKLDSTYARAPWLRVIGVAGRTRGSFPTNRDDEDLRQRSRGLGQIFLLNALDTAQVRIVRQGRGFGEFFGVVARVSGEPLRAALPLRRKLSELGPNVLTGYPRTWEQGTGILQLRAKHDFMASLFMLFAVCALALAALGVYAIIAHMVAQRTREFGVRIAVGAGERDIREMVLREGNVLALTGIALGLLVTWQSAGLLRAYLFSDYDRYDSRLHAIACVALFAIAWLASYVPARRAMRINPVEALRND